MFRILCIFAMWIGWSSYQPIRGTSIAPSTFLMIDVTKRIDDMPKKKKLEEIKTAFVNVWGNRFIYDLITEENYVNTRTKVPVICKEHGLFEITPSHHVNGVGCRSCQYKKLHGTPLYVNRKKVMGVGLFDVKYTCTANESIKKASNLWRGMLMRCYDNSFLDTHISYKGCSVCDEWLRFSNFKEWFDKNYVEGYALDKDILIKGNKTYSPKTCCFVPQRINSLIVNHKNGRGKYPIGVRKGCGTNSYTALYARDGKSVVIGTFYSVEEAFCAYKKEKESYIKEVATQYYNDGKITKKVYDALMKYEVEITD